MTAEIIANHDVLEEYYIPQSLPCRESQRIELVDCLSPFKKRLRPYDCLCHGQPGTGKTTLVKYVLEQIGENTSARTFFVNCWKNRTLSLVLDRFLEQAGLVVSEVSYSAKMSRLKKKLDGKICVVALDEVDKLNRKELNDTVYMLKGLGRVGIVCISNTRKYMITLDPRITSRLNLRSIAFPRYSDDELLTILQHRIVECRALYPKTYTRAILEKIAELAAGDARTAIQTLRSAACNAERADKAKITEGDVEEGYEAIKAIRRKYELEQLTSHHKLIIELLKRVKEISSTDFYNLYREEARKKGLKAKSSRSFSSYLSDLRKLNYICIERARKRGNVRLFRLA